MQMKLYIIEDEVLILHHLIQVVQKIPFIELVGTSPSVAKSALEIPVLKPDMVLADIRLKDGDSFQLFDKIGVEDFQLIFLTAYDQYALKAIKANALDYLLKPIDIDELKEELNINPSRYTVWLKPAFEQLVRYLLAKHAVT